MTLGPGSWGGSITSDNITPLHLINIKRLGEEIRPYVDPLRTAAPSRAAASSTAHPAASGAAAAPAAPLAAGEVQRIVDQFLAEFRSARR
jgi:acetaldehyde dehydrogenase (acetylating)